MEANLQQPKICQQDLSYLLRLAHHKVALASTLLPQLQSCTARCSYPYCQMHLYRALFFYFEACLQDSANYPRLYKHSKVRLVVALETAIHGSMVTNGWRLMISNVHLFYLS